MRKKVLLIFPIFLFIALGLIFYLTLTSPQKSQTTVAKAISIKDRSSVSNLITNGNFENTNDKLSIIGLSLQSNQSPDGWQSTKSVKTQINSNKQFVISGNNSLSVEANKDGGINQIITLPEKYLYRLSVQVNVQNGGVKLVVKDDKGNIIGEATTKKNNSWEKLDIAILPNNLYLNIDNPKQETKHTIQFKSFTYIDPNRKYTVEIVGTNDGNLFFIDNVGLNLMGSSGNSCQPDKPNSCEFFERCATEFTNPTCEYNPNWRNELTDDQKLQLREAFGAYGLDLSLFSTDPMERIQLGNYISLKPPRPALPVNWQIYRDTVAKAVYATYPYLTVTERDEIVNELENAWWRRQSEDVEYGMNGLLIAMDIVTLPETLGTANALRQGAWNLIKNPKQVGNFFVKLGKIPEAIESLRTARSPAAIGRLLEIDSEPVMGIQPMADQMDTIESLQVKAKMIKSGGGTGLAASVSELTPRIINLANDARNTIVRIGGRVDFSVPIEVAKDADEYIKLTRAPKTAAFYAYKVRKIIINPIYIRSNQLNRLLTHETMHQVLVDAGIEKKIIRSVGFFDKRINEAFTEYISAKVTDGRLIVAYTDQVGALRNFLYKYVDDYLNMKGIQRTEENILSVKQWLDKSLYDYAFTNSTQLENIYNGFYGPNKFGEILRSFFQNVPQVYNHTTMDLANEFKNVFELSFQKINKLIFPGNVYAVAKRINCCYDWPDEGELKKPFVDALQTSQDSNISEWSTDSFESLLKLEWLKNRLNENQKITYKNFQELADLDFKVEVETYEAPKSIDLESLPLDTSAPFSPSPSFETGDNLTPPDISDNKTGNQNQIEPVMTSTPTTGIEKSETIIGNCNDSNAWVCEWPDKSWKNCLDTAPGNQSLFNDTYCNGELMWKFQAAQAHGGIGSECDGTWQNYKSVECNQ